MNVKEIVSELKSSCNENQLDSVYFIACGGSLAGLYAAWYLLDRESKSLRSYLYNSSEFVQTTPKHFGKNSLAVVCTLNGTPETIEALKLCKTLGAKTIALVGQNSSEMIALADYNLLFKTVADINTPILETNISIAVWLGFELMHQFEQYYHYSDAISALMALEGQAKMIRKYINKSIAQEFAQNHKDDEIIYVMAGAPAMGVAYAFSICSLMEIQWIHSPTVNSAEFFHGPFEVLDKNLPIIHLVSDGRSRPEDLRASDFLQKMGKRITSIDAKELFIDNLGDSVKEYFNHALFDIALRELITAMAVARNHPKTVRRYMWKMEY
jgi:fructoselysine 6-phosphate deglycase